MVEFMFSKKAKKIDEILTVDLTLQLKCIRANFTFFSRSEKLIHKETHFLSHFG